jgi:hypothetical protein
MVEFGPDTAYGRNTAWYPVSGQFQKINILIAGMRASSTYHMRPRLQCLNGHTASGNDSTFTTGALPPLPFPTLTVSRPNPAPGSLENPGIEEIDITAPGTPAYFADRDGNPIWFYDVGPANFPFVFKLLPNGHIISYVNLIWLGTRSVSWIPARWAQRCRPQDSTSARITTHTM